MQYTVRVFKRSRDPRTDEICRIFSSLERAGYNLIREGGRASEVKRILNGRYGIHNARWLQSAINQGMAVAKSQEKTVLHIFELYREKLSHTKHKMNRLTSLLKIEGCKAKVGKLQARIDALNKQLDEKSYPRALFGSRKLYHRLSIAKGERKDRLLEEWRERRSNHFFSVGQANVKGNANTRLICCGADTAFHLEMRNWFDVDYRTLLEVPDVFKEVLRMLVKKAEARRVGKKGEILEGGLPYSVRVVRCEQGYQVLVSFEVEEPDIVWSGKIAGIDINPQGIACTIASRDGNLMATRFFRDNRLISSASNKRKWILENLVNKMLKWCRDNHNCNAVAVENLSIKGGYDFLSRTNFKLSNFMRTKMVDVTKLHALKMNMLFVEIDPRYTSKVAIIKYGKGFRRFNKHQLAAFVIARRAMGHGEAPVLGCLPRTKREKRMWNHCLKYYGYPSQVQTLPHHEPMEWKSDGDGNGGERITKLLKARPTNTPSMMGLSRSSPVTSCTGDADVNENPIGQVGSVHPNRHVNGGGGARGDRVNPPPSKGWCLQSSELQKMRLVENS